MNNQRILSFKFAYEGIISALKEEPNLKIHAGIAVLVLFLAWFLNISRGEWLVLVVTIGVVISLELTNTAIEAVVDSFTSENHPGAKKAKDISAGAVLVVSIMAVVVGLLIFLPYFF